MGFFDRIRGLFGGTRSSSPTNNATEDVKAESQVPFKVSAPPASSELPDTRNDIVNNLDSTDVGINDLMSMTQLAERRDQRYTIFDEMRMNDSLAAAVLEMYADDITLPDPQGRSIWVESENSNIADAGNRLLRILKIEENLWATAYGLVCYGDVYFELFREKKRSSLLESGVNVHETPKYYELKDYIERIDDPSEMFDLCTRGHTVGFARTHVNEAKLDTDKWNNYYVNYNYQFNRNETDLYDSQKFIHIYVPDAGVRHPYKFILKIEDKDAEHTDSSSSVTNGVAYTVNTGKSLLQDAWKTSQQLQLLENCILLSRLTRSSLYRLIQVNVGNKSEADVISLLNRIKSLLDKKQVINKNEGSFASYANPGPDVSNIIIPVKDNNQGAISASTIGGDYDPKSLNDLDYYINKELASFKVPRQYLNFTDGGGFNGGSSLAKISSQYAHRIVRFKRAIITGYTRLLNIYFDNRNPDYVGKFEVKMTPITTVEDSERVEMARNKLDMVQQIMDQIDDMDDIVGKFKILKDAFEDAYPNSVVSKVLDEYIKKLETPDPTPSSSDMSIDSDNDEGSDFSGGGSFRSSSGDNSFDDFGLDDFDAAADNTNSPPESNNEEGGFEFPTNLSDEPVDLTDTDAVDSFLSNNEES